MSLIIKKLKNYLALFVGHCKKFDSSAHEQLLNQIKEALFIFL